MSVQPLRYLAAVSVAYIFVLLTTFPISAQTTQTPASKVGSSVRGRVVYRDNGQPLIGVTVEVFRSDSDDRLATITNARGEFHLDGLTRGKYYVNLQGPGVAAPSG